MIFKEALRSLRNSKSKSLFFALTFFITTALLFVYFNMADAAAGIAPEVYTDSNNLYDVIQLMEKGNAGNLMMVLIVIMCFIDLLFCNDFFVKNKAQELAVRMICGATYLQMAGYLLIQTLLLMAVSIPLGILAGYGLIAVMNSFLLSQGETLVITISSYAVMEFVMVLLFAVFWTVLLNCGFAYKSGAVLLAGGNIGAMKEKNSFETGAKKGFQYVLNILAAIAAVWPLYNFFNGAGALAISMIIGCVGLNRLTDHVFIPLLTFINRKYGTKNTVKMAANGFFRRDLQFAKVTIFLLLCDLMVVLTMLFGRENTTLEYLLVLTSYLSISVLQSLTIMFRLETDLSNRAEEYRILSQIGVSEKDRTKIMRNEMHKFYLLIIILLAVYEGTALYTLYRQELAETPDILILIAGAVIPVLFADLISRLFYKKLISEPIIME